MSAGDLLLLCSTTVRESRLSWLVSTFLSCLSLDNTIRRAARLLPDLSKSTCPKVFWSLVFLNIFLIKSLNFSGSLLTATVRHYVLCQRGSIWQKLENNLWRLQVRQRIHYTVNQSFSKAGGEGREGAIWNVHIKQKNKGDFDGTEDCKS